jgi:sarcosine oxidase, subunit gamma
MSDISIAKNAELTRDQGVFVMNQLPKDNLLGKSPLHHADLKKVAQKGPQTGGVIFSEQAFMGLITLRCDPENAEQLNAAHRVLGVALPTKPLSSVISGTTRVRWIGPTEWLISVPGGQVFELEMTFQNQMAGHFQVVNVSGGNTIFRLSGTHVRDVLKKSTSIDVHPSAFAVGKVVSSNFAKSSAVICRVDEQSYELVVRRSFADYLWLWIQDASQEYGLVVTC